MSLIIESAPRAFRKGIESFKNGKAEKGIKRIESSLKDGFKPAMVFLDIIKHNKNVDEAIATFEELMGKGFP